MWWIDGSFGFDTFFKRMMVASAFKFDVVGWVSAATVLALSNVDLLFAARNFDFDVGIGVMAV